MLLDYDEIKELYGFVSELYGADELKIDKVDSTVIRLNPSKPS